MEENQRKSEICYEKEADEINLIDYLIVLVKRKKLIITITVSIAIITAIISLAMPPIYKAETKILPPQQGSSSIVSQLLSERGGFVGGAIPIKTPNALYIEMLKSRTVLDNIIDRFNLMKLYKAKSREHAREALLNALKAKDDIKSGLITIGVEDKEPKRSADMANAFIEELKNLSGRLAITEAAQRRLFFEEQLKSSKDSLIRAEESLRGFQEKTGAIIKIDEQAKAVIEGIAQIRAQIAAKEVELKVMRTYSTPHNPDLQRAEEALKGLKAELSKLETRDGNNPDPLMPTGRIPTVGTEYIRKLRDFKFNEALYELLTKQYEAARLDEARDSAIIQVIDIAIPPEKKVKPKRIQMVMIAGITGLFFSVFIAFFMEYIEKSSRKIDL